MTALIESGPAKNKKSMMDGFRDKEGKGGEKEERKRRERGALEGDPSNI